MRTAAFLAAALVVVALLLAPVGMTGHMAAHMIAVALAAPALAVAARGTRADPARRLGSPLAWSVIELAAVWLWHLPQIRAATGHGAPAMVLELACFLAAGTGLWASVLALAPERRAMGIGALLLTSMHMTLLGALIGLARRPLYPAVMHHPAWNLGVVEDQQLGGVVMLLVGGASYLIGALIVLAGLLRQGEVRAA